MAQTNGHLRVSLFCGGRGSTTIARELLRWPQVQLNLLVNAYDDGLSTGEIRDFIPGMLGPSDFRKNLSHLLDVYSNQQHALQRVLEYRLPVSFGVVELAAFESYVVRPARDTRTLPPELRELLTDLDDDLRERLLYFLKRFFLYSAESGKQFRFQDCSLGNLLFAGAYLHHKGSFNAATRDLAELFGSAARLINVSEGENRTLVALKRDGQVLWREAEIVGPQSSEPIECLYFLPAGLTEEKKAEVEGHGFSEKRRRLESMEVATSISDDAREALLSSDIIIYGPGTQFSSLMPSYRVRGLGNALRDGNARFKVMIMNLKSDYDIQGLDATEIMDKLLEFLGDPDNQAPYITHVLVNRDEVDVDSVRMPVGLATRGNRYKGAAIVSGEFNNPVRPAVHSGYAVVQKLMNLLEAQTTQRRQDTIDIYVDLLWRSIAFDSIVQEFLELPWQQQFCRVRLHVNHLVPPRMDLPAHLEIRRIDVDGSFPERQMLAEWVEQGDGEYLATLTGDGEYRLRDIFAGVTALKNGSFGAVHGSRIQSRKQFASSLRSAYGEGTVMFWISWLGAFWLTTLFALRFKVIFSDTLTGFRIYKHSKVNGVLRDELRRSSLRSGMGVTAALIRNNIEVAEIPVSYRTFKGFTKVSWRMRHALDNALNIFG